MFDTVPSLGLSLPSHEPALLKDYRQRFTFDEASIAIYSMLPDVPVEWVQQVASMPQQGWEDVEMETQLVRPAKPTPVITSSRLLDVVGAHTAMDMEVSPPRCSGTSDIGWLPHCFVVITNPKLDDHGLLLVYADDTPDREGNIARMDQFFFPPEKIFELLSGLIMGTHGFQSSRDFRTWMERRNDRTGLGLRDLMYSVSGW